MQKPKIGFIGLGLMGHAMVEHMMDNGYEFTVFANRSRINVEKAIARGASEAQTARELAEASDIIMFCVDTSESVETRMKGENGVIAGLSKGKIVIDFGTSLPASTRALGEEIAAKGAAYIDSPIGRTPQQARKGMINLMVGGAKADVTRVAALFEVIAENVFHLGDLGAGHTIKLFNNFLAMSTANIMSEIFALSDHMGVPKENVYSALAAGPLHSMMMDFCKSYAIDNDASKLAFAISNGCKDIGYYEQMARDAGVESAIAHAPLKAMKAAIKAGRGDDMVSQMYDHYTTQFKK